MNTTNEVNEVNEVNETSITNVTCKTRLDKDATVRTATRVRIDWAGVDVDQLQELAIKPVIIMAQAEWRTAGKIPTDANLSVAELLNRGRKSRVAMAPAVAAAKAAEKLSDAELDALEARIAAIRANR